MIIDTDGVYVDFPEAMFYLGADVADEVRADCDGWSREGLIFLQYFFSRHQNLG